MSQRSIRFPDDIEGAIQAEATRLDRSFSWVVVQSAREAAWRRQVMSDVREALASGCVDLAYETLTRYERDYPGNRGPDAVRHHPRQDGALVDDLPGDDQWAPENTSASLPVPRTDQSHNAARRDKR